MAAPKLIDAIVVDNLPSGGGGGGGDAGSVLSFPSRATAQAATIDVGISTLIVVHSGQVLLYRRYTEGAPSETYAPLKTNGGTVFWSPGSNASPLHWGAVGDGATNDRPALQEMMRFYFGTPETNGNMGDAFEWQRPLVVTGHNRTYGVDAPFVWGNLGTLVDTGMVYNFRLEDIRLKALTGSWHFPLIDNLANRYLLMAGWNFANDYSDEYSGIYNVTLSNVSFDCNFLTGGTWICNTYQFVMIDPRVQHLGVGQIGHDTSVRTSSQGTRPFGFNTGNGAYTLVRPNVEGLVGESGLSYPVGYDIDTMGSIGIRIYTNDAKVDSWIASRVSTAADLYGGAMLISNPHPWSREVRIRPTANNIMVSNAYLDYTKFILESFGHMFVGCHWILPPGSGADRGVELRASAVGETGAGLMFTGCTFGGESLDIRFTTTGAGTWVGDKRKKISLSGCKYVDGHTITQIERFEDKHGFTPASGAHWWSTGDQTLGEVRAVGDNFYVGKDRSVAGQATLQLQSQIADTIGLTLSAFLGGGAGILNSVDTKFLQIGVLGVVDALFIAGTTGIATFKKEVAAPGYDIKVASGTAQYRFFTAGSGSATGTVQQFNGGGIAITNYHSSGGTFQVNTGGKANAFFITHSGNASFAGTLQAVSYSNSSDERLKEAWGAIDTTFLKKLNFMGFAWKETGRRGYGLSAQKLRKVAPEFVYEDEAGMLSVDYISLLITMVQDLRTRVTQLEGKGNE